MSVAIRISKITAVISFLIIPGLHENGLPNVALLGIYFFQFFNDIIGTSEEIFWEGFLAVPVFTFLIIFLLSRKFKTLLITFLILLAVLIYITGIINNYQRINMGFIALLSIYILSSMYVLKLYTTSGK
ncbi:hypothetical protein D0817_21745 [Flavobacterium cupreum]|uniref:Uncharacterized protein n=1 Tax=Flavobacterium cupreum TaxID=2133766 RepID=A0A434A1V4_9FLAO|nr:hypothetical protein [Flavobacterium cupreum]RUT68351.1 hypothetical protein D0817_21745 [Flavobacterium cupreum]